MKKRIFSLCLAVLLIGGMTLPVRAESYQGNPDWRVAFTNDKKMDSNFSTADLTEEISGLQPGDDIVITVALRNENSATTDWWMTNEVLQSLEDTSNNSNTGGGAYGYVLLYTDKSGEQVTLFDSDRVGGDDTPTGVATGLRAATNALDEFFYLDTLATGQSGTITLKVSLDGETQGNDYQDTLAKLQMNFAVELSPEENIVTDLVQRGSNRETRRFVNDNEVDSTVIQLNDVVRTDDQTNLVPYFIMMAISGAFILILAIYSMKKSKQDKKEAK